jgi:tetratricopeptide (TPR) repeat protein
VAGPQADGGRGLPAVPGYEVLGEVGRGGMGVVYQARHLALHRLVALKTIRTRADARPEMVDRFRTEAEAIARLVHPNIIQVYEVGEIDGQPYLALEFVAGGSLARRLDGAPLPPRPAAELIQVLARAVHAAHRHGVIHRDLKPANVLLAEDGTPKITDFGLAKLVGTDRAGQTQTGAVIGTPSYMAPEQASGDHREVGSAIDVYALGAILYEMLTGHPPFRGATPLETLDQVRNREPMPPSRLQPGIPRDLGTICLKCLHKDPAQRYLSAEALSDDVAAFLQGEPIRARPVGVRERAWKWARRHPAWTGLAAVSSFAVLAVLAIFLAYHFRLQRALQRAEDDRAALLEAVEGMLIEVGDQELAGVPDMEDKRARLLEKGLGIYRGLQGDRDEPDPVLCRKTAHAFGRTAWIYHHLGRLAEAEADARQALALYGRLAAEQPGDAACRREWADVCTTLAETCGARGYLADAEEAARQAMVLLESLPSDGPEGRSRLAAAYNSLGLLWTSNRPVGAVRPLPRNPDGPARAGELFERTLALFRDKDPADDRERQVLAEAYHQLGKRRHGALKRPAEARAYYEKARALLEPLAPVAPRSGAAPGALARVYDNLGVLSQEGGRFEEAERFFLRALGLKEPLVDRHPRVPVYGYDLAFTHECLAGFYYAWRGNRQARADLLQKAEDHYRKALAIRVPLVRAEPAWAGASIRLADLSNTLGMFYANTDRPAMAEEVYREAIDLMEKLTRDNPEALAYAYSRGRVLWGYGLWLCARKKTREGLDCVGRALGLLNDVHRKDPDDNEVCGFLAAAYMTRGQALIELSGPREAQPDLTRAIALEEQLFRQDPSNANVRTMIIGLYGQRAANSVRLLQFTDSARDMRRIHELQQAAPAPAAKPDRP